MNFAPFSFLNQIVNDLPIVTPTPTLTPTVTPTMDSCPVDYTYRYFKWTITKVRNSPTTTFQQIADFRLINNNNVINWLNTVVATNPGGNNPIGEGPSNAVDNSASYKWLDKNLGTNGYSILLIDGQTPITFSGYDYITANDFSERDPISWILEASNDNINWVSLDVINNATITTSRKTATQTFCIPTILPTPTITPTQSITPTITPTQSITPTITPTQTITPTNTFTPTPTVTPTQINYSGYATTYINAVTGVTGASLSNTEITAIYDLFSNLGANGLYEKMHAIYPFMGGVAGSTKFNAKNPIDTNAAFRLTFNGGWTHSSSGITGNGTNTYANTYLTSTVNLLDFDKHYAFYNSQSTPQNAGWDGIWDSAGTGGVFGCNLNTGGQLSLGLNFLAGSLGTLPDYTTTFIGNVTGTTNNKFYQNGNLFYNRTSTVSAFSNSLNYYIGCLNVNGTPNYYSNNIYGFYCLGSKLTSTDITNLNTTINNFITAIGR